MNKKEVDFTLEHYITLSIIPQYHRCDKGHDMNHIIDVIDRSSGLSRHLNKNVNIAYTVAAFHDLGLTIGPREIHEKNSGLLIATRYKNRLKEWFTDDEINIIKEAVEDHRSSSDREPRSIYGKIVADADKDTDNPYKVITRAFEHGRHLNPDYTYEEEMARVKDHIIKKYGRDGYIKFYFPWSETERFLNSLIRLTEDDKFVEERYRKLIPEY